MLVLKYNSGCAPYSDAKIKPPSRPRTTAEECPREAVELRNKWSEEQKASGLFALGHHNPHGMVEECGLSVPELSRIPAEWGFSAGDLPPLASAPCARLKTTRNRDAVEKIVEVKSVCPFVYISSRQSFAREHRPPNDSVQPWWLPSVQWDLFFEDVQEACVVRVLSLPPSLGGLCACAVRAHFYLTCWSGLKCCALLCGLLCGL